MYCGNCFRDNALVGALRGMGHSALMIPLYLPMTLDEPDNSAETPVFFSGLNVYLEQKSAFFRNAPAWLHHLLASRTLLKWVAGRAAKTRAADLGELTLSMIRGDEGNQARELEELVDWLRGSEAPQIVCLSNALLVGMARRIKSQLRVPVVCFLQGEDSFLDALPESHRKTTWNTLAERAKEIDLFIAPSRYFGELMQKRLRLAPDRVRVVHNGIKLDGYAGAPSAPKPPVLGFFARMCREKGLDTVVDAFILLKTRDRIKDLRLHIGGSVGPSDEAFVEAQRRKLVESGWAGHSQFFPNVDLAGKQAFYRSLSAMSVPALYGEAFGLYLIEALASGVPVVQPNVAAFPELIEATGGGLLCEAGKPEALADGVERLLANLDEAHAVGAKARQVVLERFNIEGMAQTLVGIYQGLLSGGRAAPSVTASPRRG